ncbi:hypothetical protein C8J56DRAFT_962535 [Mycena floridula]|nr:hypothetical protein C8J56DRAFT_962535 [Mycena floridula]
MSHATAVVSAICGQGTRILSTIDIDCPCLEREDDLEKLSDVTTASKLSTLRHLKVNIRAVSPVETPAWSRNAEFFRRCKNLETFIIRHPRPIPFNDKDIGEFFAKMNKIKVLQLNPWPESAWDSQIALPTLECLEHARSQGRLEFTVLTHLGIFLDATKGTVEGSGTAGDYWNTLNSVVEFKSRGPSDTSSRGKLDEIFRYADILLSSDTL